MANINNVVRLAGYHVAAQAETDMGRVLVLHNNSSHYLLATQDAEQADEADGTVRIERSWPYGASAAATYLVALQAMAVRAAALTADGDGDPEACPDATRWLKATETTQVCFAAFTLQADGRVAVLAVIGAAGLVDRTVPGDQADAEYRRLLAAGWLAMTPQQVAAAGITLPILKSIAYN